MTVFFDTEFTTVKPTETSNLISIGCVSSDGREFYAELSDTWAIHQCSQFVIDTVLSLLDKQDVINEADLAVKLKDWVESIGEDEVIFRSDAPAFDWPFVEHLFRFFGCWPKNLRQKCGTIYWDAPSLERRYRAALSSYWKEHAARRHHALVDARSLRFAWKAAIKRWM